jgi:hypothetical protein
MTENPSTEPVSSSEVPLAVTLAPAPTDKTLRQRTSLPLQGFRFAAVSMRMLNMIRKSHH